LAGFAAAGSVVTSLAGFETAGVFRRPQPPGWRTGIPAAFNPTEVVMEPGDSGLKQASAIVLNQIRSVDRQRLIKRLGKASPEIMRRVDCAIQISLGLIEV
jgi:hypothetical protein